MYLWRTKMNKIVTYLTNIKDFIFMHFDRITGLIKMHIDIISLACTDSVLMS